MEMKEEGIVTKTPLICKNRVVYEVKIGDEDFMAESVGTQAVKDYLFVRKGQNIDIEGDIISNQIEVQNAKIDIASIINAQ